METFKRIWDALTSFGGILILPCLCAMFSAIAIYLLPEWPLLRYPVMVVLVLLSGIVSWKASEVGAEDMVEKGHISGVKPWMRWGFVLIGLAGLALTARVMLFFVKNPDGSSHPATVFVVGEESGYSIVKVGTPDGPYTVSADGRTLTLVPEKDGCYVANLTSDTLMVYENFYGPRGGGWKAPVFVTMILPDSYVQSSQPIDDYGYAQTFSKKPVRVVLVKLANGPQRMVDSLRTVAKP